MASTTFSIFLLSPPLHSSSSSSSSRHRSTLSLPSSSSLHFRSRFNRALSISTNGNNTRLLIARCSLDADKGETPIELKYPAFPTVMDINRIREIVPHRYPFLMVDRVVEYNPGVSAVGIKNVTINDNFFPGHFPGRPIMPGVLIIEAMAQVGAFVMLETEVGFNQGAFVSAGIDNVRFRKQVIAGDTLVAKMKLLKLQKRFGIAKMEAKAYVGGELVCEGELLGYLGTK